MFICDFVFMHCVCLTIILVWTALCHVEILKQSDPRSALPKFPGVKKVFILFLLFYILPKIDLLLDFN